MVELEIDGNKVQVPEGSMVMHAADKLDIYVPHFCYHKKLSIAANCRMCLVDVEKAPKPMPACATPVSNGMKVYTRSEKAIKAQKGVMEFLLINHPLDCPICDQGGECQLQDLAVGYGGSSSRYGEEKRVVFHKSLGPLVSAEEMSRCIHCTRCVRFGQEVAGVMELGMGGRGEHSEIMSFVGRSVDSELSGNMIDVCPVGALTSKPFRYSARTWELSRRKSVAPHDALGSNLVVQVKNNQVMRVVPLEDETLNECWISDKDRFSYEALNSDQRLTKPMLKQGGVWREVDWQTALEYCVLAFKTARSDYGGHQIGALLSPHCTSEELYLATRLMHGLGSDNVDHRLRQYDFSADAPKSGNAADSAASDVAAAALTTGVVPTMPTAWLGMKVQEISTLDRMFIIGSFLRKDQPLIAARIRQRVKRGAKVSILHAVDDDLLMPLFAKAIVAPSQWRALLGEVLTAVSQKLQQSQVNASSGNASQDPVLQSISDQPTAQISVSAQAIAASLCSGTRRAILLGSAAIQHQEFSRLHELAQKIAELTGATLGVLPEAANSVGAGLIGALPRVGGANARQMIEKPLKAYFLMNVEPGLDHGRPQQAVQAMEQSQTVISMAMFKTTENLHLADCLLPLAPFTETAGTFVNCEGRIQSFNGVVRPAGDTRPAWKVLRVIGTMLDLPGFEYETAEAVRAEALPEGILNLLSNRLAAHPTRDSGAGSASGNAIDRTEQGDFERIAEVPIYAADPLVRRAPSLQQTRDAAAATARMNAATLAKIGVSAGQRVKISQGASGEAVLESRLDATVADGVLRIAAASPGSATLSAMVGKLRVVKI
jgi:NADH-quinone oxidoreductase subunit G